MLEHERLLAIISRPVFANMWNKHAAKKKKKKKAIAHFSLLVSHPANSCEESLSVIWDIFNTSLTPSPFLTKGEQTPEESLWQVAGSTVMVLWSLPEKTSNKPKT